MSVRPSVTRASLGESARGRGALPLLVLLVLAGAGGYFVWRRFGAPQRVLGYRVVREHPHDPTAYTQGLVFDGGLFHESTGQYGASKVRTLEIESGKELRATRLAPMFFGEGLAMVGERLFQLTWKEGLVRIYDRQTLKPLDELRYEGQGWGLAYDGTHLVMSSGSEWLVFRDPATFQEVRRVRVLDGSVPVRDLNELEMVDGEVWANVWKRDHLVRIDPATGAVLGYVDLTGLFDHRSIPSDDAVLNGIAYDPASGRLWVTGKLWPKLFELEIVGRR